MRGPYSIAISVLIAIVPIVVAAQDLRQPGFILRAVEEELGPTTVDDGAVMQGLDKVTARISTFDAPIGLPVRFGTLEITVRVCHKTPPEEPPESAVYLEVVEVRSDEVTTLVFQGWMFASSPALSALEHPVYDVWVIDCKKAVNSSLRNPG